MYRRAGVATTFSPRFLAVLAEAERMSRIFQIPLDLIHADERTDEKENRFREAVAKLGINPSAPIHFLKCEQRADAILEIREKAGIELLIAGALERETVHRNFTGDVARELLKRAPADLFLFTEPKEEPEPLKHIFIATADFSDASRHTFHRGVDLAERLGAESVTVMHVQTTFAEAKEKALGAESPKPEEQLQRLLDERHESPVGLDHHLVLGNTGFTAFEFLQSAGADLLVMPSKMGGPSVFPPVLDWILQVIPTNLWVIRDTAPAPKNPPSI